MFVQEYVILKEADQYGHDKVTLILMLAVSVALQTVADWLTFRKRRHWEDEYHNYKIYHHNGHVA